MLRILRELFWLLSAGCMNFPEQFFVHRISATNLPLTQRQIPGIQLIILPFLFDQLIMGSPLDDPALLQTMIQSEFRTVESR